jgi:hypothetical protein
LRDLKIKIPGPEAEKLFIQSFDTVLVHYSVCVKKLHNGSYKLNNIDFDTGNETVPGEYNMADANYNVLLLKLKADSFSHVDYGLQQNIIKFYDQCNEKLAATTGVDKWNEITIALNQLSALKTN